MWSRVLGFIYTLYILRGVQCFKRTLPRRLSLIARHYGERRGSEEHMAWQKTADSLPKWDGDVESMAKWWRIDMDDDGFTWEWRQPKTKARIVNHSWQEVEKVCWESGGLYYCDDFIISVRGREEGYMVPSEALVTYGDQQGSHRLLIDVLAKKNVFSHKAYIQCMMISEQGEGVCYP